MRTLSGAGSRGGVQGGAKPAWTGAAKAAAEAAAEAAGVGATGRGVPGRGAVRGRLGRLNVTQK
nr:hypothetical protein GCM10010200_070150 [Actinomadura rugatobispora]